MKIQPFGVNKKLFNNLTEWERDFYMDALNIMEWIFLQIFLSKCEKLIIAPLKPSHKNKPFSVQNGIFLLKACVFCALLPIPRTKRQSKASNWTNAPAGMQMKQHKIHWDN